jgi:hypothetical protein
LGGEHPELHFRGAEPEWETLRNRAFIISLLAALVLVAPTPALAAAESGQATVDPSAAKNASFTSPDWLHALQVVANLRARPPRAPLILILGNSTAREATISDVSLTAAIEHASGRRVVARDIASSNQLFAQDAALVPFIPARRTIVFIGVDLVRFSQPPATVTVDLPAPAPIHGFQRHWYSVSYVLSLRKKRALVKTWLGDRLPAFDAHRQENLATLRSVIVACKSRGLHPVLFNTPRNTAVIGHAWSAPVRTYVTACAGLAAQEGIPFVNVVSRAHFAAGDFYDLIHAVEPGRAKFQPLLSARAARLIARYFPVN